MLTYEYECDGCQTSFEARQSIKDEPLRTCEVCGGGPVHRLIFGGAESFMKGRPLQTDPSCRVLPIGWHRGNTDVEAAYRADTRGVEGLKKAAREAKRSLSRKGDAKIRFRGTVPLALAVSRMKQYGKDFYQGDKADMEDKMRRDNLLVD